MTGDTSASPLRDRNVTRAYIYVTDDGSGLSIFYPGTGIGKPVVTDYLRTLQYPATEYSSPTLSSENPTNGPINTSTQVTIAGTGFAPNAAVRFGGILAGGVTVLSPSLLVATTPSVGATGLVTVEIANPNGHVTAPFPFGGGLFVYTTSIFTNQAPGSYGVLSNFEVGTDFSISSATSLWAMRYFKAPGETGSHTMRLWNSAGSLLLAVSVTSESPSGWQEVTIFPAYSLPAGSYRVSYTINSTLAQTLDGYLAGPLSSGPVSSSASYYSATGGTFPNIPSTAYVFADVRVGP